MATNNNNSLFMLLSVIALLCQQHQVNAFKVLNMEMYATPSCDDKEGMLTIPYLPAGRCAPVTSTAAYFFDCDAGKVSTFNSSTCSPEFLQTQDFDIKCYEGTNGNKASAYVCSDMDASKLLLMYSGNNGCGGEEFGVKTLSGSQLFVVGDCIQFDTSKSFKVVLGEDNVVTSTNYATGNCEGEASGEVISGPLEECFTSGSRSYFITRVRDSSARSVMAGLLSLLVVMVASSMVI